MDKKGKGGGKRPFRSDGQSDQRDSKGGGDRTGNRERHTGSGDSDTRRGGPRRDGERRDGDKGRRSSGEKRIKSNKDSWATHFID